MKTVIIGAGDYGKVLYDLTQVCGGYDVVGFIDDNEAMLGREIQGLRVLGTRDILNDLYQEGVRNLIVAIGNNKVRNELLDQQREMGFATPTLIHPTAYVPPGTKIGQGVYILARATFMPYITLEDNVIVSMGALIAHHSLLRSGAFVSTGCNVGAQVKIGFRAFLGIGATIMTGVAKVGDDALVGAGAVVIEDVPERAVVAGVPAKILRYQE